MFSIPSFKTVTSSTEKLHYAPQAGFCRTDSQSLFAASTIGSGESGHVGGNSSSSDGDKVQQRRSEEFHTEIPNPMGFYWDSTT